MSEPMSQPNPTPPWPSRAWRFCASCWGVCHWQDEAWVCNNCRGKWYPEHDPNRYGGPE
jgi:hypothetical protein